MMGWPGAWAQSTPGYGAVQGAVVDIYGEGIPDTKVTVTNAKLGIERTFMTSDDGIFDISGLQPADGYSMKLTRTGFANWETGPFDVPLGQALNFRIPWNPQSPAAHVEASTVLPVVDTTKFGVNTLVSRRQLYDLPTADLRFDELDILAPWVGAFSPVFESPTSPPYTLIDGGKVTNSFNPDNGAPERVPEDTVQSMQVLANGYPASFPGAFGGIADIATSSGGTGYHGDAYGFFRDGTLAATDRYDALGFRPAEHRDQGGVTIGGPMLGKKLFFFANYEAMDGKYEGLNRITNPIIADPTGAFVLASNCKATVTQCEAAAKFVETRMNAIVPRSEHSGVAFAKFDYRKSDRNAFSLEANGTKWVAPNGAQNEAVSPDGSLLGNNGNIREDTRYLRGSWVGTPHATTVNEMRASWTRDDVTGTVSNLPDTTVTQLAPSAFGPVGINIAGAQVGAAQGYPFTLPDERRRECSDSFSKAFNTHVIQFGVDLCYIEDSINRIYQSGTYDYATLHGVRAGLQRYHGGTQDLHQLRPAIRQSDSHGAHGRLRLLFQDTWRFLAADTDLTARGMRNSFCPRRRLTTRLTSRPLPSRRPNIDGAPRLGLSFTSDDHTVFRASYGWFFAPYAGQAIDALEIGSNQNLGTTLTTPSQTGAPIFPTRVSLGAEHPRRSRQRDVREPQTARPPLTQATLSMEKLISQDTTLTLSLIATRGIRLWTLNDLNFAPPTKSVTYDVLSPVARPPLCGPLPCGPGRAIRIPRTFTKWTASPSPTADALTAQFHKRSQARFNFQAVYTWAHATDDAGYPVNGVAGLVSVPGTPTADKGNSATDQRHRAVASWIWTPTVSAGVFPAARQLLNGWALSGYRDRGHRSAANGAGYGERPAGFRVGHGLHDLSERLGRLGPRAIRPDWHASPGADVRRECAIVAHDPNRRAGAGATDVRGVQRRQHAVQYLGQHDRVCCQRRHSDAGAGLGRGQRILRFDERHQRAHLPGGGAVHVLSGGAARARSSREADDKKRSSAPPRIV